MKKYINKILKAELLIQDNHLKFWGHYRIKFQYEYLNEKNVLNDVSAPNGGGLSFRQKIIYIFNVLIKLNLCKLLFSKKEVLVFSHPRAKLGSTRLCVERLIYVH
jgi:hypothetical protein